MADVNEEMAIAFIREKLEEPGGHREILAAATVLYTPLKKLRDDEGEIDHAPD